MIERIRALLAVIEEGSVNRASARLRITQPALSRQMRLLESEIGGRLLERGPAGVKPTALGHEVVRLMRPVLADYATALAELRRHARGERSELRAGYLVSASASILEPALERFRAAHPRARLKLLDQSPKEQIDGLRAGELDLALVGQEGAPAAREFHAIKLRSFGVCVALSAADPLARRTGIALADLRGRDFVGVDEDQVPGRNRWMISLCRSVGFKPRFSVIVDGITHVLSRVVSESAVTLLPDYFLEFRHPGAVFVPLRDRGASWDFIVLAQRGRIPPITRAFLEALREAASAPGARSRKTS